MPKWYERAASGLGNMASNYAIDPLRSAGRGVKNAWEWASGADAAKKATDQQLEGYQQGLEASQKRTKQAQDFIAPYNDPSDMESLRRYVKGGVYDTQRKSYRAPEYQAPGAYSAPTYQNPGQMSTDKLGAFGMQGFNTAMPTAPQRQAATAENVNMYMDPGYQFRLEQGLKGITNSAGTMGSGSTLKALMGYGQGLASQEFGNAYGRFMDNENLKQGDFRDSRDFTAAEIDRMYDRAADDRNFGRGAFESDRAFGRGAYEDDRNFGRNAFTEDRAFGRGVYESDIDIDRALNADRYGRHSDLVGISRGAAGDAADLAYRGGQDEADYLTDMADIRAGGTLARSKANREMLKDVVNAGFRAFGR